MMALIWLEWAHLDTTALYATEFLGYGSFIQGSESGNVFFGSADRQGKIKNVGNPGGAADDFVYLGNGTLLYSTYTEDRNVYISYDRGETWINSGKVPTNIDNDWLDHVIRIDVKDSIIAIGGTNKGFIVRAFFEMEDVGNLNLDN